MNSILDLAAAMLIVVLLGWAHQAWRRHHPRRRPLFQYRLRTLLLAVAVLSVFCARWKAWRDERRRETELLAQASGPLIPTGPNQPAVNGNLGGLNGGFGGAMGGGANQPGVNANQGWLPPYWLPESLVKLLPFAEDFAAVTDLALDGATADDEHLRRAEAFTELRSLALTNSQATAAGWESLRRFARLTSLEVGPGKIPDAGLEQVAALGQLTRLSLSVAGSQVASVRKLQRLTRLECLDLSGVADEELVASIGALPNLEWLELDDVAVTRIVLLGCPKLRYLRLQRLSEQRAPLVSALKSVRLDSLPALESFSISATPDCELQLHDLPKLRDAGLGPIALDAAALREIPKMSNLESLVFSGVIVRGPEGIDLHGLARLKMVYVWQQSSSPVVRLHDLPSLESVTFENNPDVGAIKLGKLPSLETFKMFGCPRVAELDLRGVAQLKSLAATDAEAGIDTPPLPPDQPHPRIFHGLGRLAQLETAYLSWTIFEPAAVAELGRLTTLTSLNLDGSRLTDADLNVFAAMRRLEQLDLGQTSVSAGAIGKLRKECPNLQVRFESPK